MNRNYIFLLTSLLCVGLAGCAGKDKTSFSDEIVADAPTEEFVEDAAAIYGRIGIDMSMAEQVDGTSDFEYSIVDETVGQVRFVHEGEEIRWIASGESGALDLLGISLSDDGAWVGTTLDAEGVAEEDADDSLTDITCVNVEGGGCVYRWNWHGIKFSMLAPWECDGYSVDRFIYRIAENSYVQPGI